MKRKSFSLLLVALAITGPAAVGRAQRPKDELRSLLAEVQKCIENIIELQKESCSGSPVQNQERKDKLKEDAPNHNPPREISAVFGNNPGHKCENNNS